MVGDFLPRSVLNDPDLVRRLLQELLIVGNSAAPLSFERKLALSAEGLEVSDRIVLGVSGSEGIERALAKHRAYIMSETLATEWETGQAEPLHTASRELGDDHWTLEFRKAT